MTTMELNKATEIPGDEKGHVAFWSQWSAKRIFLGRGIEGAEKVLDIPLREWASICTVLIGAIETCVASVWFEIVCESTDDVEGYVATSCLRADCRRRTDRIVGVERVASNAECRLYVGMAGGKPCSRRNTLGCAKTLLLCCLAIKEHLYQILCGQRGNQRVE
jgi:hypothetical protein